MWDSPPNRSRLLLIVNPKAGGGRTERLVRAVVESLRARGVQATVRHTQARGDGRNVALAACEGGHHRPDCIVACGGDGTVQEAAGALASLRTQLGSDCPALGVLPAGRCNDFARSLGLPRDPTEVSRTLINGAAAPVDLGKVNGVHFCTVATAGIDAEISRFVDGMSMPLKGTPAYLYGALRVLARYRPHHATITGDFGEMTLPIFLASTANTPSYGGAIPIAPSADPADGLLDVCVIKYLPKLRALRLIPLALKGRHGTHPAVRFLRTERLTMETQSPIELWADGEPIGTTPATIEADSAAIRVCRAPPSRRL